MSIALDPAELARLRDDILALTRTVGHGQRARFRTRLQDLEIEAKGPRDLVTIADRESEQRIVEALARRCPGHTVLSEESGSSSQPLAAFDAPTWIVDPLDGTTNYAHGHPLFCISVALWWRELPQLAVVHAPALDESFAAVRDQGAWSWCGGDPVPRRLALTGPAPLAECLLATGFSYGGRELEDGALRVLEHALRGARGVRRGGSAALDLAYTAAGIFGGFWEYHLAAHDVAAGALLVTEAGGLVTDVTGGRDYLQGGSIVAAHPSLHAELLDLLAREGPTHPRAAARP